MTAADCYQMFKQGSRVKVIKKTSNYKRYNLVGEFGTVVKNQYGQYGKIVVDLDNMRNSYGASGHFYFKPHELSLVNENENDILEENNMQNVINYYNIAKIQYLDSNKPSEYNYANFEQDLRVGDLCVVASAHHGFGLGRVTEIIEQNDIETCREIVAKVDTEYYDHRVTSRKNAAEMKAKMQERAKQLQDIALYQMLAEKDPEMQELLNRYQNLPLY